MHGMSGIDPGPHLRFQSLQKEDKKILFEVFFNKKKASYLGYLKKTIPIFLNLHLSFWKNPHFLRWQLIRVNPEYQAQVEKIWRERWTRAEITERQEIKQYFFDFKDCFPRKVETPFSFQDTYETWEFAGYAGKGKNGKTRFGIKVAELMEKWKVSFPPIPWVFRFIPTAYLQQVPPIPGYGYGRPKRGRPIEDWGKNLSVYELSHAGMKDMEIARLVFGFTRSRHALDKETILVRIDAIRKTVNNIVSRAYPFPSST